MSPLLPLTQSDWLHTIVINNANEFVSLTRETCRANKANMTVGCRILCYTP
jgi:hypothetical protein